MSIILDSLNNIKTEKTPVWLMRQAGRHLPEYMKIRSKFGNLMEMFKDPDVCATVTMQPVDRYNLDAAIIFTDILMIHMVSGAEVLFENTGGPKVYKKPNQKHDFKNINFLYKAIEKTKNISDKPLIGFAGGPWTALTYLLLTPQERLNPQKYIITNEKKNRPTDKRYYKNNNTTCFKPNRCRY